MRPYQEQLSQLVVVQAGDPRPAVAAALSDENSDVALLCVFVELG